MFEDYYFEDPDMQQALAGIGYYTPTVEPVRTPAVMPSTVQAEPIMGIGSPAVAAPAAAPSVIETAAAPMSYEALADRRAAANALPRGTFLAAPTDNLGKATGYSIPGEQANTFEYRGGPVRVTDRKGNVLFSGEGPEGALAAVKFAQNLSDTKGKNASWDLQQGERTINPDGSVGGTRWVSGPSDAKEGMGVIGDLAAFALPIAAAILTAGMSIPAQMAIASAAGMVGGVMSGKDPLKSALIAGATAGVMAGSGANEAIGKVVNNVSTAVTNTFARSAGEELAKEVVKNAVGELGEQIVVTAISKTIQGVGSSIGNTLLSEVVKSAGLGDITGYKTPAEKFVEQTQPEALQTPASTPVEDAIVVSGERITPAAAAAADVITGIGSGAATDAITGFETPAEKFVQDPPPEVIQTDTQPPVEDTIVVSGERITPVADAVTGAISGVANLSPDVLAGIAEFEKNPIVSTGTKTTTTPEGAAAGAAAADVLAGIAEFEKNPIVSTGTKTTTTPEGAGIGAAIPGVEDFLKSTELQKKIDEEKARKEEENKTTLEKLKDAAQIVSTASTLVPLVTGGGGDGVKPTPDTTGITFKPGTLTPILPGTGVGGTVNRYPYTPQTYGRRGGDQETEFVFFTRNPVTGQGSIQTGTPIAPATTPAVPGRKEGGEIDDDMVKHLVDYHKNGGHRGPGQVKGIGSGQEDKIPAYLSDGEYVWSAQDVSDLGDGSNDEGVRRLNKMRQMVRQQAGRKDIKKIAKPQKGIDRMLKAVGGMA